MMSLAPVRRGADVERRRFMSTIIGTGLATAAGASGGAAGQGAAAQRAAPELYLWREYIVRNGTSPAGSRTSSRAPRFPR
jgi:hypothetical protein